MKGDVWIGDVLRALHAANAGTDPASIARLLGFRLSRDTIPAAPDEPRPAPGEDGSGDFVTAQPAYRRTEGPPPGRSTPSAVPPSTEVPLLRPVGTVHSRRATLQGESLARVEPVQARATVPLPPLFAPGSETAILQGAVSRREQIGEVDLTPLIRALAHGEPVARIPRRPALTLRHGVEILVDLGPGMVAFRRDQEVLMRRMTEVIGRESVRFRYFASTPSRVFGPYGRWSWRPYPGPARGATVVLLSDLGLGSRPGERRDRPEHWLDLAAKVTRVQGELVAFLPFPPDRRPAWSHSAPIRFLTWDRVTTVADARRRP